MRASDSSIKKTYSFFPYQIFIVALLVVIIPLFIYSIFLYKAEFQQKKEDIMQNHQTLILQMENALQDQINFKEDILNLIIENKNINNYELLKFSEQFNLPVIFCAELINNSLIIKSSSKSILVGKNVSFLKNFVLMKKNYPANFFKNDELECSSCIFLGKKFVNSQKKISIMVLGQEFKDFFKVDMDIDVSIVDFENNIFFSTNPILENIDEKNLVVTAKQKIKNFPYYLVFSSYFEKTKINHLKNYFVKHGILLFAIFLFLIIISIIFIKILTRPIRDLLETMHKLQLGESQKRYQKHKFAFEINDIGQFFNETIEDIFQKQKQVEKEKIEKEKYLQQLQIAHDIQKSLLPDCKIENPQIAYDNIYAMQSGGDFYDFIEKDDKLFFVIVDVAGKGINACLYALTLRSIIRSQAFANFDLEKIIINTNNLFYKDAEKKSMFATAFFGMYDKISYKLSFCNAGHVPAILKRQNDLLFLSTKGKALGIEEFKNVDINQMSLKINDLLFLYTDGVIDAIDEKNQFFSEKKLTEFIQKSNFLSSNDALQKLFKILTDFSKKSSQYDDIAAVIFKII